MARPDPAAAGWEGGPEAAPHIAGDLNDDDGQILARMLAQAPQAIDPAESNAVVVPVAGTKPPRLARLLSGYITVDPNTANQPLFIAPADDERSGLHVRVDGATSTDLVFVADEPNKLSLLGRSGQGIRVQPGTTVTFDDYNGAMYALGQTTTSITITWWSVTK